MQSPKIPETTGIVIEGGGSHTSAAYYVNGELAFELHGGASNPRSVSESEAGDTLKELLSEVKPHVEGRTPVYAAHGAASTRLEAELLGRKIGDALGHELLTQLVVVNDLVPIALSEADRNVFVAAAGTGTGYVVRSKEGRWHRASGYEYMISDEGGGFDIGQKALRAATKDIDGRGRPTMLTALIAARLKCARPEMQARLFEYIYEREENIKYKVATFADIVFEADTQGDEVAATLLDDAATEISSGIEALERAVDNPVKNRSLILTGSLLTAQRNLRDRVLERQDLSARFDVSTLGSMSLLQTTALLMSLNDSHLQELEQSSGIPFYVWKGEKDV